MKKYRCIICGYSYDNAQEKVKFEEVKEGKKAEKTVIEQQKEEEDKALIHTNKVVIEDFMREAGYMLPESKNIYEFLEELKKITNGKEEIMDKLLDKLEVNG